MRYFSQEMNRFCKKLQLFNTKYANPHGLMNKVNKSTTNDQARLSAIAMENKLFREVVGCKKYSCSIISKSGNQKTMNWVNTNKLLKMKECWGIKTGFTSSAGPCLSSYFNLIDK